MSTVSSFILFAHSLCMVDARNFLLADPAETFELSKEECALLSGRCGIAISMDNYPQVYQNNVLSGAVLDTEVIVPAGHHTMTSNVVVGNNGVLIIQPGAVITVAG